MGNNSEDSGSGPKRYRWTTHKFYCTDCEAPRFASMESIESYSDPFRLQEELISKEHESSAEEIVDSFDFCLACAHGPEAWANECSNPEGEVASI